MNSRYALPGMARLWTDQFRYDTWVRVEILAAVAQAELGVVPAEAVEDMRRAPVPAAADVLAAEQVRDHEVLSFLAVFCAGMPESSARWVHLGMTSYDLEDTAGGWITARATDLLLDVAAELRDVLAGRAGEHWDTVCIGRTHGIHAEPTTFGHKLAGHAFALDRSVRRLQAARQAVAVGTISGAVGTYALIDPRVEASVCAALGLDVEPAPSQVVARDRHAQLIQAVALHGACVEQLAVELRLLQRTEIREVEEARTGAYQGSSAMPHKRNPTTSERVAGLARLLRGYASAAVENVPLWHERDLAHEATERVVLEDALTVAHYQTTLAAGLIHDLTVHTDRMRAAIDTTSGSIYSSLVLTDLLTHGLDREKAYRVVQAAAAGDFTAALAAEGIDPGPLHPERFLRNHGVIAERLAAEFRS